MYKIQGHSRQRYYLSFDLRWLAWLIQNWHLGTDFSRFDITYQVMKNSTLKFTQSSIISEKPGYFDEL